MDGIMTDFQQPMARVKGLGSSHTGVTHWVVQRFTAVLLIPFGIWFLLTLMCHTQSDYQTVVNWAGKPWNAAGLALFISTVLYHSTLGCQVVIEDYVPNVGWKTFFIWMVKTTNLLLAVLSFFFIIKIMMATS